MGLSKWGMVLLIVCVVVSGSEGITCGEVATKLQPCIAYMRSGGTVPPNCCNGIKALNSEAKTTADRQQVCNCVKTAITSIPGLNLSYGSSLGPKCGVNVPFKVSPNADCASIK